LNIKIFKKFLFEITCDSNSEMNRYVNIGIELNTTVESLQKHLRDLDKSRDVSNENKREKLMTVKKAELPEYALPHKNTRTNLGGTRAMPLKTAM
jgi:hypothetical protein